MSLSINGNEKLSCISGRRVPELARGVIETQDRKWEFYTLVLHYCINILEGEKNNLRKLGKNMVQYKRKPSIAYLELRLLLFVPGLPLVDNLAPK